MSQPKTITIDDTKYIRADATDAPTGDLKLVVLPRGFIYVGELECVAGWCRLTNASNVRRWVKGGFGGLTLGAKSSGATLDKCCPVQFSEHTPVSLHDLPEGWLDA